LPVRLGRSLELHSLVHCWLKSPDWSLCVISPLTLDSQKGSTQEHGANDYGALNAAIAEFNQ